MDKYEYNIKAEQIVKLIGKKDFSTAAKIADGIDWKRVRSVNMLTNVGNVYAEVGRYQDAKEILLLAFERAPIGRRLAYKLTEVCIRMGDFGEAERYYNNFVDLAPRDAGRYELQYKMAKKKGEPVEKLIAILKEYKKNDFEVDWAYELARLYHKAGMADACISECDEIILWFGEGEYVEKAMELKMLYVPLSPSQQEKYDRRYQPQMRYAVEQESAMTDAAIKEQIPEKPVSVSMDIYNTANIQAVLAESMKELMQTEETEKAAEASEEMQDAAAEAPEFHAVQQEASGTEQQEADELAATKDLRHVREALKWNNMSEDLFRIVPDPEEPECAEMSQTPEKLDEESVREAENGKAPENGKEPGNREEPEGTGISGDTEESGNTKVSEDAEGFQEPEQEQDDAEYSGEAEEETEQSIPGRLSEERRRAFMSFLHINGMEEKLAEIFEEAEQSGEEKETSLFGNILIIGDHKSGKTTLATELMRNLSRTAERKNRKIAKISGDRLNNKGIKETIARLLGADLLIERAGEMNHSTVQELLAAMEGNTGGMVVVLEDTQEGMEHLLAENPEVEVRFTHKLVLKEYEISEWVELAKQYAKELDYGIDEMATLALSAKIDALYAQKTVIELKDVKAVIDRAIEHSERKNIKKLFETVFSRKYKDSDLTMLRENDF